MIFWALAAMQVAALGLRAWQLFPKAGNFSRSWQQIRRDPLALVLAYAVVDNAVIEGLHRWLFVGPAPVWHAVQRYGAPARLAYHVETGLVLGWPALTAWASWRVFYRSGSYVGTAPVSLTASAKSGANYSKIMHPCGKTRDRQIGAEYLFGAWLIAAGGLAAVYPLPRGWTAIVLHAVELAFVAAALASLPAGWRSRAITRPEGQALGVVLVGEMVNALVGAWAAGQGVYAAWDGVARVGYIVAWAVLCGVLLKGRRASAPTP